MSDELVQSLLHHALMEALMWLNPRALSRKKEPVLTASERLAKKLKSDEKKKEKDEKKKKKLEALIKGEQPEPDEALDDEAEDLELAAEDEEEEASKAAPKKKPAIPVMVTPAAMKASSSAPQASKPTRPVKQRTSPRPQASPR